MDSVVLMILALALGYNLGRRKRQQAEAAGLVEVIGPAEVQVEDRGVHVDEGARFLISVDRVG